MSILMFLYILMYMTQCCTILIHVSHNTSMYNNAVQCKDCLHITYIIMTLYCYVHLYTITLFMALHIIQIIALLKIILKM